MPSSAFLRRPLQDGDGKVAAAVPAPEIEKWPRQSRAIFCCYSAILCWMMVATIIGRTFGL